MKILLTTLNSKYIHTNLAIRYLYTIGGPYCDDLEMCEFTINNTDDYIYGELIRGSFDVICFSCYIWNIERILTIAENIKKARPQTAIVLGGPEVSYDAEELMKKHDFIDVIIKGEGEYIFSQLCSHINTDFPEIGKIKGITYRCDGEIFDNGEAAPVRFDTVPFPYSKLPCEKDKIIYYESSRGCPYRCNYCISSIDKQLRYLPLDRVKSELSYFVHLGIPQVKFIDRTFNASKTRCVEIMKYIKSIDKGVTNFHMEICGDLIDEEFLNVVKESRPGLFQFEAGIQSTNPKTLLAVNRNSDCEKNLENLQKLIEINRAHVHVDLIAGLPYEGWEEFRKSFNDVYELGADCVQIGFLKLLKGTSIRGDANFHRYVYRNNAPYEVISNRYISAGDIAIIKQIENVFDLFYNRGGFEYTLDYLLGHFEGTAFDFYEEFARFFYIRGYQHRNHSKENTYRILHDYINYRFRHYDGDVDFIGEVETRLEADMANRLNFDAIKKFKKKGWDVEFIK